MHCNSSVVYHGASARRKAWSGKIMSRDCTNRCLKGQDTAVESMHGRRLSARVSLNENRLHVVCMPAAVVSASWQLPTTTF